jgi:hypothetical protein
MLKKYKLPNGITYQFEEGKAPAGAVEVGPKAEAKEPEEKAAKPKDKSAKPKNKAKKAVSKK